jgi:transposase-like protein
MTQRRDLSDETRQRLAALRSARDDADLEFKRAVIAALTEGSIRDVAEAAGTSTSRIYQWRADLG